MYQRLKEKAREAAREIGLPSFYKRHRKEILASSLFLESSSLVCKCWTHLDESRLHPGHGIQHALTVAVEGGAIVGIEAVRRGVPGPERETLITCVQIAGLLHDIRRREKDHTIAGSREAERILEDFAIEDAHKRYICAAIKNHEAFREVLPSENETAELISDALYDADKFRWGPDNFVTTVWLIIESAGLSPEMFYREFTKKMEGIRKIRETFRTDTGREFGPEFIDFGIEIGIEIYHEMGCMIGD